MHIRKYNKDIRVQPVNKCYSVLVKTWHWGYYQDGDLKINGVGVFRWLGDEQVWEDQVTGELVELFAYDSQLIIGEEVNA